MQLATTAAHAEPNEPQIPALGAAPSESRPLIQARSDTYLRLFRRALLPGPNGAIVDTGEAPIYEYLSVRASQVAPPWRVGSVDAEVSAWGTLGWGEPPPPRLDGDLTTAFVHQRLGPAYVRLGRQAWSSAAARYVRFDGVKAGARYEGMFGVDSYVGWTVLPRWNARPGYQYLGSAADSLVRDAEVLGREDRSGWSVAGGRVFIDAAKGIVAGASFHDERQAGELARQSLGLDVKVAVSQGWSLSGSSSLDTDSWRLADARLWLDLLPSPRSSIAVEYLRTDPALFLSRQSVLSVFATSAFDEVGTALSYRPLRHVATSASLYAQVMQGEVGMRSEAKLRATLDESERLRFQLAHTRMLGESNGYHALRTSLGYTISSALQSNAELYLYRYDEPIVSSRYSIVRAANVSFTRQALSLLWGVSWVQSPYARADLQSLVRLSYAFDDR